MTDGPMMANGRRIVRNEAGFGVPGPAPLPDLTVRELMEALAKMPPDAVVRAWTPGAYWHLGKPFENKGKVLLEGNLAEGRA